MRVTRALRRDDRGMALVEFALVMPALMLVLVGCLDFGRALNAYVIVANASREGARYAMLHPDADASAIKASVTARIAPLDASAFTVTPTYDRGSGPQPWPVGGIPPSSPVPAAIRVHVVTSYEWQASTWIVGSLFSATGSRTFGSSSTMETVR